MLARIRETVRDRFWIWAHDAGCHSGTYVPMPSRMTPAEGAFYLGVPNLILVRYGDKPAPPFDQYAIPFRPLKHVVWSIVGAGGATADEERNHVFELAGRFPNITGVIMDDFFKKPGPDGEVGNLALEQLKDVRDRLTIDGRKLELWVVLYDGQLDMPVTKHLELCDVVTFWTWGAADLVRLDSNFGRFEKLVPAKRKVLGCYMYDYSKKQPMPVQLMQKQCETGLRWLRARRIEGMIFLASCICDLELDAVEWTRRWIAEVGDEPI